MKGTVYMYAPSRKSSMFTALTESDYKFPVEETMGQKIIATLVDPEDGHDIMVLAPQEIQDRMPTATDDIIKYDRWNDPDMDAAGDENAYTTSRSIIKTQPIFDAICDLGYTTRVDSEKGFWDRYRYDFLGKGTLKNPDGSAAEIPADAKHIIYHASVIKILDTKDLSLKVGDKWDDFDNLTYHQDCQNNEVPLDKIKVDHNVDTSKPGVYDVKYSYEIADGHIVSRTAKVTVVGPEDNDNNGDKDKPDNTDDDNKIDDTEEKDDDVKTGDESGLYMYFGVAAAAALGLIVTAKLKRK